MRTVALLRTLAPVLVLAVLGCASATEPTAPVAEDEASKPTQLAFDLPAGFVVKVDGKAAGTTPLHVMAVDAGPHAIDVLGPCGTSSSEVTVVSESTAKVELKSFPDLKLATLQIRAQAWKGSAVGAEVTLHARTSEPAEAWTATATAGGEPLLVPACSLRMRVESEGLGAFVEDVELEVGASTTREIVLAPGPDVVRVHGGSFVAGPSLAHLFRYQSAGRGVGFAPGDVVNVERDVETFDLDRSEVTAGQYVACVEAGACTMTPEQISRTTRIPKTASERCNVELTWPSETHEPAMVRAIAGREDHPANCVAIWEAEQYCKWIGKRLPTSVEWEYAARSRKTDYTWPWGKDERRCRAHTQSDAPACPQRDGTAEVCSYPDGNNEQGICDLVGNVKEWLEFPSDDPRRGVPLQLGGDWQGMSHPLSWGWGGEPERPTFGGGGVTGGRNRRLVSTGFRCARSVDGAAP